MTLPTSISNSSLPRSPTPSYSSASSDYTSDDDLEGVFFGAHDPSEHRIIARLSHSNLKGTEAPTPETVTRRIRLRKRDSREFLRRKTLLHLEAEVVPACPSSPTPQRTSPPREDLSAHLASIHLSDDDKENTSIPVSISPSSSESSLDQVQITMGALFPDEDVISLDMGGLQLSDLADPIVNNDVEEFVCDFEVEVDENEIEAVTKDTPAVSTCDGDNIATEAEEVDNSNVSHTSVSDFHEVELDAEVNGTKADAISPPPPHAVANPGSENDLDEINYDSPLPLPRGGPVVIPVYSRSIRADISSPCRPLTDVNPIIAQLSPSRLPLDPLESPTRPRPTYKPRSPEKPKEDAKTAQRVIAVRTQLDAVFATKLSAFGPPSRGRAPPPRSTTRDVFTVAESPDSSMSSTSSRPPLRSAPTTQPKPRPGSSLSLKRPASGQNRPLPTITKRPLQPVSVQTRIIKPPASQPVPLKRFPVEPPREIVRQTIATGRPTLGLPMRPGREYTQALPIPISGPSFGIASMARPMFKSPKKVLGKRPYLETFKSPARFKVQLGTPSRAHESPAGPSVRLIPVSVQSHQPLSETAAVTAGPSSSSTPPRGSSEDHEDVSMMLPRPSDSPPSDTPIPPSPVKPSSPKQPHASPKPLSPARAKRQTKPAPPAPPPAPTAPTLSETELRKKTQHNTMKNQVYFCAIERQIVKKSGARPPSPDSKMRSSFVRPAEEEIKLARGERAAKRRGESPVKPAVADATTTTHMRGRGEDEDYVSPQRKRTKLEKSVRWDKGLVSVCDEPKASSSSVIAKSAIKRSTQLDPHGNLLSLPPQELKRTRIVVTAVYYDGEEPVPTKKKSKT